MSIIINGAGIVGTILALILAKLTKGDLQIYLIDKVSPTLHNSHSLFKKFSTSPHVIALSRGGYSELLKINMHAFISSCSGIIKKIEISDQDHINKVCIDAQDYQLLELGYVIELDILRKKLFDILYTEPSITICCPATIKKIICNTKNNTVILDNGLQISAKLMVAADGAYSSLATSCGMEWFHKNYRQIAIVTKITTEFPHYGQAFEKFTCSGSLALLPISTCISFVIWCISDIKKEEIISWSANKFSQKLQHIFGWTLGKIINIEQRHLYNLQLIHAKSHILHRLVLVGNAAQNLHPIAGQGFNLGLRDVIILSKIIAQAFYANMDIGDHSILNIYQRKRYIDQCITINITDGLVNLFSNKNSSLMFIRNLGLCFLSYSRCLKRLLIYSALHWKTD